MLFRQAIGQNRLPKGGNFGKVPYFYYSLLVLVFVKILSMNYILFLESFNAV